MDARIQKLKGASAAIAAQMQGLFREPGPVPHQEQPDTTSVTHEHAQHHEWIARVHEHFPSTQSPEMLVNVVVGGRVAMSLHLPVGSPLPDNGEDVTLPWPFGVPGDDAATMRCRVTRREFQFTDGAPPAVALHVLPHI
jgi:hypothetical protein